VIPSLARDLWLKRPLVRQAIIWALVQLNRPVNGSDQDARAHLPELLLRQGTIDLTDYISRMTREVDTLERRPLIMAFVGVLEHHHAALRAGLLSALTRHRDVVLRILRDLDSAPDRLALGSLTRGYESLTPVERRRVDEAIAKSSKGVRRIVRQHLEHADPLIRRHALSVYAKLGGARLGPAIERGLSDPTRGVQISALTQIPRARRLGLLSQTRVNALWRRHLAQTTHWLAREAALEAIAGLGGPEASDLLSTTLKDDGNAFVRETAARLLEHDSSASGETALIHALGDRIPQVRAAACSALAKRGVKRASGEISRLLGDRSALVRRLAAKALKELK
jgi:HEAT repeat protein